MKKLIMILIAVAIVISACSPEEETEPKAQITEDHEKAAMELEKEYIKVTEEFLHNADQTYTDLIYSFEEPEYIEAEINSITSKFSELFSNSINQERADTAFLLTEDYERYNKYKRTRLYLHELNEVVADITAHLNSAALNYDDNFIPELEAKVIKMNRLTRDTLDQLVDDSNSIE